jgi:magnesium-transporting ATPase (P-type)
MSISINQLSHHNNNPCSECAVTSIETTNLFQCILFLSHISLIWQIKEYCSLIHLHLASKHSRNRSLDLHPRTALINKRRVSLIYITFFIIIIIIIINSFVLHVWQLVYQSNRLPLPSASTIAYPSYHHHNAPYPCSFGLYP